MPSCCWGHISANVSSVVVDLFVVSVVSAVVVGLVAHTAFYVWVADFSLLEALLGSDAAFQAPASPEAVAAALRPSARGGGMA